MTFDRPGDRKEMIFVELLRRQRQEIYTPVKTNNNRVGVFLKSVFHLLKRMWPPFKCSRD